MVPQEFRINGTQPAITESVYSGQGISSLSGWDARGAAWANWASRLPSAIMNR